MRTAARTIQQQFNDGVAVNTRSQILSAWCGILCPLFLFAGLWPAAGFFPPHLPSASAAEIAAIYQRDATGIRFGAGGSFVVSAYVMKAARQQATESREHRSLQPSCAT